MSEHLSPYLFCESTPKAIIAPNSPRALISLAIEKLTEQHALNRYWDSGEQRAIASLQAALFHLSPSHG